MDCEARVSGYWPKGCGGGGIHQGGCVPADPIHIKSCYDPPNISPLTPKKWHLTRDSGVLFFNRNKKKITVANDYVRTVLLDRPTLIRNVLIAEVRPK
ncbi:hypothetical protein TNCV_2696151 [Trichonephila clavipes]|nr:hypothetical protein TNCV_2696151 [Trichonephila clavipes]